MAEEKNYRASTGVDEFYYGVLDEAGPTIITGDPERIKFLQTITVEMPQEVVRAYGDNTTAEMAVSSGDIAVTSAFHKIPLEDKKVLLGWEEADGLVAAGSDDNPPYVATIFAKTHEDGSREYVGLPKGIFTRPNVTGNTKGDTTEFSSDEITAQFMDRKIDGFAKPKSVIFAFDGPGETMNRDALFMKVFGKPYPGMEPDGA